MPVLQTSSELFHEELLLLARCCLLIPDPILFLGAIGTGAFLTRAAVDNREADGRLSETPTEIFLGATGATGAGFLRAMATFDGPDTCVLAEARTLPVEKPVKTPGAGTKGPANKNN